LNEKKHRIATTISDKHWALLTKYAEKFETQQKALELALECLEKNLKKRQELTIEKKYWMVYESINSMCCVQKDSLRILMETINLECFKDYVAQNKPIEYIVEYFHQKSLIECSLEEVVYGLTITFRISHLFDTVDYKDNDDYYMMALTHSLGLNNSKLNLISMESVFKTYGANIESRISEKTIFIKIFKNKCL
jgi:hypothetical protein